MTGTLSRSVVVPVGAGGGYLTFAPTRSRITGARVRAAPACLGQAERFGVHWVWIPGGTPAGSAPFALDFEIDFEGEAVRPLALHWLAIKDFADPARSFPSAEQGASLTRADWKIVHDCRRAWSTEPGDQAFMFEFDRQTNECFVGFVEGLSNEERMFRIRSSNCLAIELLHQLHLRWLNRDQLVEEPIDRVWVAYYSAIFWSASDKLFAHGESPTEPKRVDRVAAALEQFAAGALRSEIKDPRIEPGYYEADTNSMYIYLFGELGFASIRFNVDRERWRELLPVLVKLQRYFNERCDIEKCSKYVSHYGQPARALDRPQRQQIDLAYQRLKGAGLEGLSAEVHDNLSALSNIGFCDGGPPARCFGDPVEPIL